MRRLLALGRIVGQDPGASGSVAKGSLLRASASMRSRSARMVAGSSVMAASSRRLGRRQGSASDGAGFLPTCEKPYRLQS